jgi:AcrR family transcriptional regulator
MGETGLRRRYDSPRRQAQTRATRAKVVDAARRLFLQHGYPATTIEMIGDAADVPLATVYRLFTSKRGILQAVLEVSFVGDDQPIPLHERPTAQAAAGEQDPQRLLAGFARLCREVLDRSAPMQHVLRTAAVVDPDAAQLLATFTRQRLAGQAGVAQALTARNALAKGINERHALDVIYTLMSPEVHHMLTMERHWTADQYQRWLTDTLCATLLRHHDTKEHASQ